MSVIKVVTNHEGPIRNAAAEHGYNIGYYWPGVALEIDDARENDKWVPIVGPAGLGPTWKDTGMLGWIEKAHTIDVSPVAGEQRFLLIIQADGSFSCVKLA